MDYNIVLRKEAQEDIDNALAWYKEQRPGLEISFWESFKDAIFLLQEAPLRYREVHKNFRKISLHIFPYNIYYRMNKNDIVILAVIHQKRHPKIWKKRK